MDGHFENKTTPISEMTLLEHNNDEMHLLKFCSGSSKTWGIDSLTGSLSTFNGEPKLEGALCFIVRGEPQLLGESGGALPAGNMDGNELLVPGPEPDALPGTFKGAPATASWSNDATYKTEYKLSENCLQWKHLQSLSQQIWSTQKQNPSNLKHLPCAQRSHNNRKIIALELKV